MRATHATQGAALHHRPQGLLQEDGISSVCSMRSAVSRWSPTSWPRTAPEELARILGRQRVEALLRVGRLAAPAVLVLGAVVDQEAEPGGRETLD
jgi:hypothetical protein